LASLAGVIPLDKKMGGGRKQDPIQNKGFRLTNNPNGLLIFYSLKHVIKPTCIKILIDKPGSPCGSLVPHPFPLQI